MAKQLEGLDGRTRQAKVLKAELSALIAFPPIGDQFQLFRCLKVDGVDTWGGLIHPESWGTLPFGRKPEPPLQHAPEQFMTPWGLVKFVQVEAYCTAAGPVHWSGHYVGPDVRVRRDHARSVVAVEKDGEVAEHAYSVVPQALEGQAICEQVERLAEESRGKPRPFPAPEDPDLHGVLTKELELEVPEVNRARGIDKWSAEMDKARAQLGHNW